MSLRLFYLPTSAGHFDSSISLPLRVTSSSISLPLQVTGSSISLPLQVTSALLSPSLCRSSQLFYLTRSASQFGYSIFLPLQVTSALLSPSLCRSLRLFYLPPSAGHFGSAIVAYYRVIKWLFLMNIFIMVVILCVIILPQQFFKPSDFATSVDGINITGNPSHFSWKKLYKIFIIV